ncbi:uncharacterized protein LOC108089454 [Drosophila ficusphila]|uniref:uncharacterized protein LOC108089454 n=1 Tax=Drosophila ficusphila TaxID=30025 RepID=UPI0007E718DC|nr:uncharacterized protein LOC108089454 [Drosophila ficusphila]
MNSQFTKKATPEPTTTPPTAIELKTTIFKLAGPKSKSATSVAKQQNRRRRNDVPPPPAANNSKVGNNIGGSNSGGSNSGGGGNAGVVSNKQGNKESCQFVAVRRKPLGEYMVLEAPPTSSRPSTSDSLSSVISPPMSYAAAVEMQPETTLKIKVVLSPRLKRASNQQPVKRPSPRKLSENKPKPILPAQTKPPLVHASPKRKVAPQPRVAQVNPKPVNLTPTSGSKKSRAKRSKKAKQKQRAEAAAKGPQQVPPPKPTEDLHQNDDEPKFSDAYVYLNHHHEQMKRILAEQTAGQEPLLPKRGHVKPGQHSVQLPTHRSLFDFDERLFKRGDLEAAALLAQNKAMLRKWLNPSLLIS